MENLFKDSTKIHTFARIQERLCELQPNSSEAEINAVFELIPTTYLETKEDLKVICLLFAYYNRNNLKTIRGNGIKLFEKLMKYIKRELKSETVFLWNIFGGLYFFKHWFYEEGLIPIDIIVQSSISDETLSIAKFFLPEIIEETPEIYEKKFKGNLGISNEKEYVEEFKELRNKHFKWLRESNDYKDPKYREIEKNPLRLAVKTDDIDRFQTYLSSSNLPIESKISESILENSYFNPLYKVSLIDYVIEFNSTKIFKYLIMNGATIEAQSTFNSIRNRNYELIHIVESKNEEKFKEYVLVNGISSWNNEIVNYALDNYDFGFIEEENISTDRYKQIIDIANNIFYSCNFIFFETYFLPFLQKNEEFLKTNIHEILIQTLEDQTSYFLKEFLKYPGIDVNYHSKNENDKSILVKAIHMKNYNAVKILLKQPGIDISKPGCDYFLPFHFACGCNSYLDIIKLFCDNEQLDIKWRDPRRNLTAFDFCIVKGNFYALEYIIKRFPEIDEEIPLSFIYHCISKKYLICCKHLLKIYVSQNETKSKEEIIIKFKNLYAEGEEEVYADILKELLDEIK